MAGGDPAMALTMVSCTNSCRTNQATAANQPPKTSQNRSELDCIGIHHA